MRRLLVGVLVGVIGAAAIFALDRALAPKTWAGYVFNDHIWSGEPPLEIAPLREIVNGAQTDDEAAAAISRYYAANAARLVGVFDEANETRLRALFGMYITHVAVPYNTVENLPRNLLEFVSAPTAHCGVYAVAQGRIYDALGLTWRMINVDRGWHGLDEALIDGKWETFDATNNLWIDISVGEMLAGATRSFRLFYTPLTDAAADARYRAQYEAGYNINDTRQSVSQWGLSVFPGVWETVR